MACHGTEIPPLSYFRNAFGAPMEFCLLSFSTSRRFIDGIHQSWQPKQHGLSMFPPAPLLDLSTLDKNVSSHPNGSIRSGTFCPHWKGT